MVRPKKHLGQHFLADENIAKKIVQSYVDHQKGNVLEIGPGKGVLTKYLLEEELNLKVVELDDEAANYLSGEFDLQDRLVLGDVLKQDWTGFFDDEFGIIGNLPYNISSPIFFKILEHRDQIDTSVVMIQKEVAERIASKEGSKVYGILSVLLQAYFDVEYLFTVNEQVFIPPPRVKSAVIRLVRKTDNSEHDFRNLKMVVKMGFNNRRKTLRNALKSLNLPKDYTSKEVFNLRAEQLSVSEFIELSEDIRRQLSDS